MFDRQAYMRKYQQENKARIRAYNNQWASKKRAALGARPRDEGLPAKMRAILEANRHHAYSLAELCSALPGYARRDVSRTVRSVYLGGYCNQTGVSGWFRYQWNAEQQPKAAKCRPVVAVPQEPREFHTCDWLGGVLKGELPLGPGRKIIAEEMAVA